MLIQIPTMLLMKQNIIISRTGAGVSDTEIWLWIQTSCLVRKVGQVCLHSYTLYPDNAP